MARWLGPADAVLQQAAWWIAVLGAARGAPGVAAAAGAAVVALHLLLRGPDRPRVAAAAVAAAAWRFLTDSLLVNAGLVAFGASAADAEARPAIRAALAGAETSPAWMAGLWAAFGAGLTASLRAVAAWPAARLAAVAAVAGPFAYHAGAVLGAMEFPAGIGLALAAVAAQWALGVPALAGLAQRAEGRAEPGSHPAEGAPPEAGAAARTRWRWVP